MIVPKIAGFRCFQSPADLVTEMKSEPKNTRLTSGTVKRAAASGERAAAPLSGKSATEPSPMTSRPGRNFKVAGLGVDSVWMNMSQILPSSINILHGPREPVNQLVRHRLSPGPTHPSKPLKVG